MPISNINLIVLYCSLFLVGRIAIVTAVNLCKTIGFCVEDSDCENDNYVCSLKHPFDFNLSSNAENIIRQEMDDKNNKNIDCQGICFKNVVATFGGIRLVRTGITKEDSKQKNQNVPTPNTYNDHIGKSIVTSDRRFEILKSYAGGLRGKSVRQQNSYYFIRFTMNHRPKKEFILLSFHS